MRRSIWLTANRPLQVLSTAGWDRLWWRLFLKHTLNDDSDIQHWWNKHITPENEVKHADRNFRELSSDWAELTKLWPLSRSITLASNLTYLYVILNFPSSNRQMNWNRKYGTTRYRSDSESIITRSYATNLLAHYTADNRILPLLCKNSGLVVCFIPVSDWPVCNDAIVFRATGWLFKCACFKQSCHLPQPLEAQKLISHTVI